MVRGFVEYQALGVGKEGAYQRNAGQFATAQRSRQPMRLQVRQSAFRQRLLQPGADIPPSIEQIEVSGCGAPSSISRQRVEYWCQSGNIGNRPAFCGDDLLRNVGDRAVTRDLSALRLEQADQRSRQHTLCPCRFDRASRYARAGRFHSGRGAVSLPSGNVTVICRTEMEKPSGVRWEAVGRSGRRKRQYAGGFAFDIRHGRLQMLVRPILSRGSAISCRQDNMLRDLHDTTGGRSPDYTASHGWSKTRAQRSARHSRSCSCTARPVCSLPHATNRTNENERNNPQCAAGYRQRWQRGFWRTRVFPLRRARG